MSKASIVRTFLLNLVRTWTTRTTKGGTRYQSPVPPYSASFYFLSEDARTRFEMVPKIAEKNSAGSIGNKKSFNVMGRPGIRNTIGKYAIIKKTI